MEKFKLIIVIDDDSVSNFLSARIVAKSGVNAEVRAFLNGREALDYLEAAIAGNSQFPDVIFLDVNMPLMNGWEFLYEYKGLLPRIGGRHIPIYMLSSSVYTQDIQRARELPEVSDYIIKPITVETILSLWKKTFPES